MKITSQELRAQWVKFYQDRGHKDIGAVSLIGDGSTGVMFNVAGMQPLMPYLLGQEHPAGNRLVNVQGCVRTVDIDEVGDSSHFTFFEMMGNWSLGDYFKQEKTQWSFLLLTEVFGLDKSKICSTVFEGNDSAPRDTETANMLLELGIPEGNIFYMDKSNNWWELEGTVGTPCGPDNEWFYPLHDNKCCDGCDIDCACGRYVEVGNDVYMQYIKTADGYAPLANKNVDTGFGLDRLLAFLNGFTDGYKTDLFADVIALLESASGASYDNDDTARKAMRIVADHIRTATMLIGDVNGILPSNTGAGYILRRLLRRAIRYAKNLNLSSAVLGDVATVFIDKVYATAYPLLVDKKQYILDEIARECSKFEATLTQGIKEFDKCIAGIARKNQFMSAKDASYVPETVIVGKQAFRLYDTFGFPVELTVELALEHGYTVDTEGFAVCFAEHQAKSKAVGTFKSGLADDSVATTNLHTATHLLQAALKRVLGDSISQKGSNITPERLRFDFNFDRPMTAEEIATTQELVNKAIADNLDVVCREMPIEEARKTGAIGLFGDKYGDVVRVYSMGDFSCELCSGPHAANTGALGKFVIAKEQSSSAGVRRIRAELKAE